LRDRRGWGGQFRERLRAEFRARAFALFLLPLLRNRMADLPFLPSFRRLTLRRECSASLLLSFFLSLSLSLSLSFSLSICPAAYVGSPPLINLKLIPQSPGTRILLSPFLIYCTTRKLHRAANARMQPEITLSCESS